MLNCAILDDYQNCALNFADWDSLPDVKVKNFTQYIPTPDALAEELAAFEIIVAMRERTLFDPALLDRLPRLKLLVTTGMKNVAIDIEAAMDRGITVCGTKGLPGPTPEFAWGLLLALARNIPTEVESVRAGGWQTRVGVGLGGKTLGIIGLGTIGTRMARFAHAFEMSVLAWSPRITDEACKAAGVQRASSLDDLMERSDFVTLHMVLADSTRGLIGAHELSKMKPSAMLVNTSRGPLINEDALVQALKENRIAGAALDVYDTEPLPSTHPFRTLPNVICTPHLGYVTTENYRLFYGEAVEDIQAWLGGSPVRVLPGLKGVLPTGSGSPRTS
jgi:phosphoglycerate dehydrogenase-like enzyme